MKLKQKMITSIIFLFFLLIGNQTLASTTNGTIDTIYSYAWGENVGFINFGSESGNVHITDDSLSGYAYGENIGWIDLSTITNDEEGNLSSYAWGENVGFIDFGGVTINNNGFFTGQAYGENIGFIIFNTNENNKVTTDWRPKSNRRSSSGGGGSIIIHPVTPTITPIIGCSPGNLFNTITGISCGRNNIIPIIPPNPSDGQATLNIQRALKLIIPRMNGNDIKDLQTYLNSKGYDCGFVDGIFGTKTKQAVIKFQIANKLTPDGIVGLLTRLLLK